MHAVTTASISMRPRRAGALLTAITALTLLATGAANAAVATNMRATSVRCSRACHGRHTVARGGAVVIGGHGFARGSHVVFPVRVHGVKKTHVASTRFVNSGKLVATVPSNAISGRVFVKSHRHRSNAVGPLKITRALGGGTPTTGATAALAGNGMWIWYVSQSSGGDPNAIIAQARQHNVSTLFVKSSDGTTAWSQFSPSFVAEMHAAGLHVCAWQYVYGTSPATEAALGAQAVKAGADCLVIDAEKEYEGRYAQASTYMSDLRAAVGSSYPLALASFPYVDYHPSFPYSVFLQAGGAQYNLPQVYWKAIGTSVDTALNHTYVYNRPYGAAIEPIGQAYDSTTAPEIVRFRQLARADRSAGVSWWDWQDASSSEWQAIGETLPPISGSGPQQGDVTLQNGAQGDLVIWAQEHLNAAGANLTVDGQYGPHTTQAVKNFQASHGLSQSGEIDTPTWQALLRYTPPPYQWAAGRIGAASAGSRHITGPPSARLPAKRYEIPPPNAR